MLFSHEPLQALYAAARNLIQDADRGKSDSFRHWNRGGDHEDSFQAIRQN